MKTLTFHQLDVFTDRPLTGNAVAVFPDAADIEPSTMQALAREMNLSETTFVSASDSATRRVRFFTPAAEIPLAGHPTIGTWWILAELGVIDLPRQGIAEVTQETGAGILPVYLHLDGGRPSQVVMVQAQPEFGPILTELELLGEALGGGSKVIATGPPPQVVSTALPQLMIPIRSLEELRDLPTGGGGASLVNLLRTVGTDCAMCYSTDTVDSRATVHCRMFAPGLGVPEDPATGSAAGALGAYLTQHDIVFPKEGVVKLVVEQGIEIARPSLIRVEIDVTSGKGIRQVRVGGEAVTVIRGEVAL